MTWWKNAIAYQIYPRSFQDSNGDGIGDIQGIIQRLSYLKELGIDLIWICPMYQSPNDDNGYDISNYQEILAEYGTMNDFDQLLEEVHQRGMRLIIDLVLNHTSDEHAWFIESKASKESKKRDWYIWRKGKDGQEPNNWASIFGGSAWTFDEKTDEYYLHIFSKKQPDLNWENQAVRHALYDTVNWWLEKGVDGFRIDAISHIKKSPGLPDIPPTNRETYVPSFSKHMNQPGIHDWLLELKKETYGKYPVVTVGEANGVSAEESLLWVGKDQGKMDMVFQFEHLGLWDAEEKPVLDIIALKEVLTKWQVALASDGWNALFLENHDKPRIVSTWGNDKDYWYESATALACMYFFMKGTPFIYQGQEIGMTNVHFEGMSSYYDILTHHLYKDKQQKGWSHKEIMKLIWASSRDNSRTPMQWSSDSNAGFTEGKPWMETNENYTKINVTLQKNSNHSVLQFYKDMITLRKTHATFIEGEYNLLFPNHKQIFAYTREDEEQMFLVIVNLSECSVTVNLNHQLVRDSAKLLLWNYQAQGDLSLSKKMKLRPYEARVYRT
ncbi:glycoside hydrolase family 13 protein [Cytobacillus kochii]|uniref:glycoside hydrolase family 13 protein n=1 Tax=Cytobacillus kochii TaxID=859143 RepID=UPI00402AB4E0